MNIKTIKPIKKPLLNWPNVGAGFPIADYHFNDCDAIEFTCPYKGYDNKQVYPDTYRVSTAKRKEYHTTTENDIRIRLVPMADVEVIKDE